MTATVTHLMPKGGDLPFVSVIISNRNGGKFLQHCLASLGGLRYPNYEVIVVDAGSTDDSSTVVKTRFPEVALIEMGKIGIGEAINVGIQKSKGDIVVFDFNSDEMASCDWLSNLVEVLNSSAEIGVVGGTRVLYGTDGMIDDAGARISFFGHSSKIARGQKLADLPPQPKEVDYVSCIATRKDVIKRVGLLDEAFFIYGEDADFCIRVRKATYKVVQVPAAVTYHMGSASVGKQTPRYVYFNHRAILRNILKHFSIPKMAAGIAWVFFLTMMDAAMFVPPFKKLVSHTAYQYLSGRDTLSHFKASLDAVLWNFRNIRATFASRIFLNEF
jgi:GT2 family glycosyltransferase